MLNLKPIKLSAVHSNTLLLVYYDYALLNTDFSGFRFFQIKNFVRVYPFVKKILNTIFIKIQNFITENI